MPDERPALTTRQNAIFQFIVAQIDRNGAPPTLWEIGYEFGICSKNGVVGHLKALERKGYIRRSKLKARGIEIVGRHDELLTLLKDVREYIGRDPVTDKGVNIFHRLKTRIAKLEKSSRRRS